MRIKARGSPLKISKLSCQTTKIGSKQRRSTIWNHASLRYTINETSEVRFAIYAFDYALRINLQHASAPSPCAANDNVRVIRAAKPVCRRTTERGKISNPEHNIKRDQPTSRASPLRINVLLSCVCQLCGILRPVSHSMSQSRQTKQVISSSPSQISAFGSISLQFGQRKVL